MNLPNILTMSRIVMIPVFVVIFYLPMQWSYLVSAIIFALAGLTDWLDGYLARAEGYYKQGARFAKWRNVLQIDPASGLPAAGHLGHVPLTTRRARTRPPRRRR